MKTLALALLIAPALAQAQEHKLPASRPALFARSAAGPGGYEPEQLAKDLENTSRNLTDLAFYLEPYKKEIEPPSGQDAEWAQKTLVSETQACDKLIQAGDEMLAKGLTRKKVTFGALGWPSAAMLLRKKPTVAELQRDVAIAESNVAGHLGSLIESRASDYKGYAEQEAKFEEWLQASRKHLAEARKRLEAAANAPYGDKK